MVPRLAQQLAEDLARRSLSVLQPFLTHLDRQLDVRLVRTLAASVLTIICHGRGSRFESQVRALPLQAGGVRLASNGLSWQNTALKMQRWGSTLPASLIADS